MYLSLMEDRLVYDEDKEMVKNAMILLALVMSFFTRCDAVLEEVGDFAKIKKGSEKYKKEC